MVPLGRPMGSPIGTSQSRTSAVQAGVQRGCFFEDTFLQWEPQHGVTTAWLASARGRPCVLARRRCALRSFHKYTWPDLVPSQTPWKSTESYRHCNTLRHPYRYTAPCGPHKDTTQGPHKGPHKGTRTRCPHKALHKEPCTSPHKARTRNLF